MVSGRKGSRGFATLLAVTALALLLQVVKHVPASIGLPWRKKTSKKHQGFSGAAEKLVQGTAVAGNRLRRSTIALGDRVKDISFPVDIGELNTKIVPALRGLRAAAEGKLARAAADGPRKTLAVHSAAVAPAIARAGRQIESKATEARQRIERLYRQFVKHDAAATETPFTATDNSDLEFSADVEIQASVFAVSDEVRQQLEAASAEIQEALGRIPLSPSESLELSELSTAEIIQQIRIIAVGTGERIFTTVADAGKVIEIISRQDTNATVGPRKRVRTIATAAVRNLQPVLGYLSNGTAAEALRGVRTAAGETVQATVSHARRQISAAVRHVGASCVEARQGAQAVAAMARRYMEVVEDEALDTLGLESASLEAPPPSTEAGSDVTPSSNRTMRTMLLIAAVVGVWAGLAIRGRRAAQSASTVPPSSPGASPARTTSPKASKVSGMVTPPGVLQGLGGS